MNVSMLKAIQKTKDFFWPMSVRIKAVRLIVLVASILFIVSTLFGDNTNTESASGTLPPVVYVGTVADVTHDDNTTFIGTVRAVSEAQIQSESGGRITAVYAKPGDRISAGTIIATLENASQQASLLQAQGAYEIALANAAQSDISVSGSQNALLSAQNAVVSTYRDAYTTTYTTILNDVDVFFSDPDSILIPGVRINSFGNAQYLNTTRKSLNDRLLTWSAKTVTLSPSDNLDVALAEAKEHVRIVTELIDALILATSKASVTDTLDGMPVTSYTSKMTVARAALNNTLSTLESAETSLANARENLRRAEIGGTQSTEASLANAQVKQALGVLRSAQANYEKTVFRSPISGTVNNIRVNTGDFITAFTPIAEVANNDALQISLYVGEQDISLFAIGDVVGIQTAASGTVTSISPAIDPVTQKIEVKIATESSDLTNGSTVTVSLEEKTQNATQPIRIPITAIKFNANDGSIFIVEDGVLKARPVTVGTIVGSLVTIESGVTMDTEFVLDARGLSDGQRVEATRK